MRGSLKIIAGLTAIFASPVSARDLPADPLGSPMWTYHAERLFENHSVVFDDRIKVTVPQITENQHVFPVTVDARALEGVQRIVIFADLNPIPVAVEMRPVAAGAFIGTRIKLDQRTPVRAAVQLHDGSWHVAGEWVDAAGGGCSAPPLSRVKGDWADHLGEMRGAGWFDGAMARLRLSVRHPMDTGLVENIPAYNLEKLVVTDKDKRVLAELKIEGSIAEDPSFTLIVEGGSGSPVEIAARDTSGLEFNGQITPVASSRLAAQ